MGIFFLSLSLAGCEDISQEFVSSELPVIEWPVKLGDDVFTSAPSRVVSLSPALTEAVCSLGYESALAGRSSYCAWPESVSALPAVGSSADPEITAILELKPELVISQSPLATRHINQLEQAGIRTVILPTPRNLNELKNNYEKISTLFSGLADGPAAAKTALEPLVSALDRLSGQNQGETFVFLLTNQLSAATGDTLAGEILSYCGENAAQGLQNYEMSLEALLEADPDMLFLAGPLTLSDLPKETGSLEAVKKERIISIDSVSFERPTVRLLTDVINGIIVSLQELDAVETGSAANSDSQNTTAGE